MAVERVGLAADLVGGVGQPLDRGGGDDALGDHGIAFGRAELGFQISLPVDAFARNPGIEEIGPPMMSTAISGTSASAFSSRRLPMKHQGQTTSETTSMRSAAGAPDETGMTNLRAVVSYELSACSGTFGNALALIPSAIWGRGLTRRNTAHDAGDQRIDIIGRLERRQRHRGVDAAIWREGGRGGGGGEGGGGSGGGVGAGMIGKAPSVSAPPPHRVPGYRRRRQTDLAAPWRDAAFSVQAGSMPKCC